MKNFSFLTQSLKKKSLVALTTTSLATSLAFSQHAFADACGVDPITGYTCVYDTVHAASLTYDQNSELLEIKDGGSVSTTGAPAIDLTGPTFINTRFYLLSPAANAGVISTNAPALEVGGNSSMYILNIGNGTMSSNSLSGTIYYHGVAASDTHVSPGRTDIGLGNPSSAATIINTNSGPAINWVTGNTQTNLYFYVNPNTTIQTNYTTADTTPTVINILNNSTSADSGFQILSQESSIGVNGAPTNANITAINLDRANNSLVGSLNAYFTKNSTVNGNILLKSNYSDIELDNSTINGDIINNDGERVAVLLGRNSLGYYINQTSLMNGSIDFSVTGNAHTNHLLFFQKVL